ERILSITGEDLMSVDKKYSVDPVTQKFGTRLIICSNEMPHFDDASGAFAHRLIPLEMTTSHTGHEDVFLTDRLLTELSGIFLWPAKGLQRLREREKFDPPKRSFEIVQEIGEMGSPVRLFLDACCIVGENESVSRKELHSAYLEFAK